MFLHNVKYYYTHLWPSSGIKDNIKLIIGGGKVDFLKSTFFGPIFEIPVHGSTMQKHDPFIVGNRYMIYEDIN